MRGYTIEFYQGNVGDSNIELGELLTRLLENGCPPANQGGMDYEVRNLRQLANGEFSGVLAKFRHNDIPHAGEPGGAERDLGLDEHEGLMEKNYFLYYPNHHLLVYQRNGHGSAAQRFSNYLCDISNEVITFDPLLQLDATERLMNDHITVRSISVRFARPQNRNLFPAQNWNRNMLDMLTGLGGASMNVTIKADGRRSDENRYLLTRAKEVVRDLLGTVDVQSARIEVDENGEHVAPIDLIADRLLSRQTVEMHGRYPDPGSMFAALRQARNDHLPEIEAILGGDAPLD